MRLIALLVLLLALVATGPTFAGRCKTGVRTPRSVVFAYRKRAGWLTVAEAAERVGMNEDVVVSLLERGSLRGEWIRDHWRISPVQPPPFDQFFEPADRVSMKVAQTATKAAPPEIPANPQANQPASARVSLRQQTAEGLGDRKGDAMEVAYDAPKPTPQILPPGGWYTRKQAAAYTQYHVGTIDKANRAGRLRSVGGKRSPRFRREWLDRWLEQGAPTEPEP